MPNIKLALWCFIGMMSACPLAGQGTFEQNLDGGWSFRQERGYDWYPATVPGTVHTDLMASGLIPDPFIGMNERSVQWVDKEDWRYRTVFDAEPEVFSARNVEIVFDGLDTYADVYLNGQLLLSSDNMFRQWTADVRPFLREKGNVLEVLFHSPIKVDLPKLESVPYRYEASNDQSQNGGLFDRRVSVFARKAGYHYGWDWGPRLVTSGIWRPVYLRAWDRARISDIYYRQAKVGPAEAEVTAELEILSEENISDAVLRIAADGRDVAYRTCNLEPGLNRISVDFVIKRPKLWWTRELGEPYLYDFSAELSDSDTSISVCRTSVGLRSFELVREEVEDGVTFMMKLNGEPLFMKGANYIPCDVFLPRVTPEIYERTIADAAAVNMNMLRVWGGGVYEDDCFYELCDRYGILVWQDFMFACSVYPVEGAMAENIRAEAEYNLRRLRNHPCVALWCGNNECNDAWYGWGWKNRYIREGKPEYSRIIEEQLELQYYGILPEAVAEFSPHTPYHPSSPWSRRGGVSEPSRGDMHNWQVWHGNAPISSYNTVRSRFFSEYGFQSFPGVESIRCYVADTSDWRIDSDVMMSHQRGGEFANMRIAQYMEREYWRPDDFRDFIYMSHVLQGDAIKTAIEAHRRDKPYCWGSLFWQHNDCWPVASWSSRDWYGCWKAQHYFARHAFDDILVSPVVSDGRFSVTVVSDRLSVVSGVLDAVVMDVDGNVISEERRKLKLKPNSSTVCMEGQLPDSADPVRSLLYVKFTAGDRTYSNIAAFSLLREMELPAAEISYKVTRTEDGYDVTVSSDRYARAVWLTIDGTEHHFSDNYFDLLPGTSRTVSVRTELDGPAFAEQFRIRHLAMTK